jgi:hypothetical protein
MPFIGQEEYQGSGNGRHRRSNGGGCEWGLNSSFLARGVKGATGFAGEEMGAGWRLVSCRGGGWRARCGGWQPAMVRVAQ